MPVMTQQPIGLFANLACIWETTARKPGNVHRFKDFGDVSYVDFVTSAAATAEVFDQAWNRPVGETVLEGVKKTRRVTRTNTNLGILLLLAPLAKALTFTTAVGEIGGPRLKVEEVLKELTVADAHDVYRAIRIANPAVLGHVDSQDISDLPTLALREVMALAADRDLVARQYANGYCEVFEDGVPALQRDLQETATLENAIIACHLHLLAQHPDSLIGRKCGKELAEEASRRAAQVIGAGWPHTAASRTAIDDFDAWLRADGHRRNPGTTADLVAASLFVALREGIITLPPQVPWSADSDSFIEST